MSYLAAINSERARRALGDGPPPFSSGAVVMEITHNKCNPVAQRDASDPAESPPHVSEDQNAYGRLLGLASLDTQDRTTQTLDCSATRRQWRRECRQHVIQYLLCARPNRENLQFRSENDQSGAGPLQQAACLLKRAVAEQTACGETDASVVFDRGVTRTNLGNCAVDHLVATRTPLREVIHKRTSVTHRVLSVGGAL